MSAKSRNLRQNRNCNFQSSKFSYQIFVSAPTRDFLWSRGFSLENPRISGHVIFITSTCIHVCPHLKQSCISYLHAVIVGGRFRENASMSRFSMLETFLKTFPDLGDLIYPTRSELTSPRFGWNLSVQARGWISGRVLRYVGSTPNHFLLFYRWSLPFSLRHLSSIS